VSLCLDTGHVVLGGGDPIEVARRHRDRLVIAHWKDAIGQVDRHIPLSHEVFAQHRPFFRTVGAGSIDWTAWLATLAEIGFAECILLKLDAAADPVTELINARTHVTAILTSPAR
jgi:inosose dehydratase